MTGSTIGHYEVGEKLGAGGMGVVYRARDTLLGRAVALKFLPESLSKNAVARSRFLREAKAASALEHPNIATIYEIGEHEDSLYIAMALYEGETLLDRMAREPLSLEESATIVRQLLEAVAAAHAAGIVHRDLKPANVILARTQTSATGRPLPFQCKVVDFGLAKVGSEDEESTRLTMEGSIMGTVSYMSPEQARGEEIDHRSDLWSIGVIGYEMLTGRNPFDAQSKIGKLTRIATENPEPLGTMRPEIPEPLQRLIAALLQKDRNRRPSTGEEALAILGVGETSLIVQAPPLTLRSRWKALAIGGGIIAGVAAVLALMLPHWLGGGGGAGEPGHSFVVLPCQVFGAEEVQYLADAVPATLSTLLGQVEGIDTRRPPSRVEVDPATAKLDRLADAYGVANCVTCTVTIPDGRQMDLGIQLVEPGTERIVWSLNFQGTTDAYLALIRESAEGIRDKLLPGATEALVARPTGSDSRAELAFQRGKYYSERFNNLRNRQDLERARAAFTQALQLDPALADAAGEIAILELWSVESLAQVEGKPREWALRALDIDENCSRAWVTQAFIEWARTEGSGLRPETGLDYALKAIRHGPEDGLAYWPLFSFLKLYSTDLALEAVGRATTADPLYSWGHIGESNALFQRGDVDAALDRLEQALEIEPDSYFANSYKTIYLATAGRLEQARAAFARVEQLVDPSPPHYRRYARFALELAESSGSERRRIIGELAAEPCEVLRFECMDERYRYLIPLMVRHDGADAAVALLDEYANLGVMPAYDWLMLDPDLAALRDHPRFADIAAGARAQYLEFRRWLDDARGRGELPEFLESPLAELDRRLPAS